MPIMLGFIGFALLNGCRETPKYNSSECLTNADCSGKRLCVQGLCSEVECYSNSDCGYGHYCTEEGVCDLGCNDEADCPSGEYCAEGVCEPETCTETELDCRLGEWCNEGVCVEPEFPICQSCGFDDWQGGTSVLGECIIYTFEQGLACNWPDATGCPEYWSCFPEDGIGETSSGFCVASFWYLFCDQELGCPRGFSCDEVLQVGEPNVCWADCDYLMRNGFLEAD